MAAGPTQRSLERARKAGQLAGVVERWNPHARIRQDLFGFLDLLVVDPERPGVLGVQATSASNVSSRVRKILDLASSGPSSAPRVWLEAGNRIEVWGWRKKSNGRWDCRVVRLELPALDDPEHEVGPPPRE